MLWYVAANTEHIKKLKEWNGHFVTGLSLLVDVVLLPVEYYGYWQIKPANIEWIKTMSVQIQVESSLYKSH